MKKFYQVVALNPGTDPTAMKGTYFKSIEDAAKQIAKNKAVSDRTGYRYDHYILEAVKAAKVPEPQPVELVDLE